MNSKEGTITSSRAPFVLVSKKLASDSAIPASAKSVYLTLCRFSNNSTRNASPGRKLICKEACVSDSTLSRSLKILEESGYIKVTPKYKKDASGAFTGERLSNDYHIEDV